jgi:hypothetical protein
MNREKERNQKRADLKREGRTETLLAFLSSLQVALILTASAEGKRRQSRAGSTSCLGRAATVPALAEGLPCNFWSFRDCFVIFRLCYCNIIVIFV